jgi:hypothetical protein
MIPGPTWEKVMSETFGWVPDTTTGMVTNSGVISPCTPTVAELQRRKAGLIAYCQIKLEAGDWHAVQDAASDIRELDAKLEVLRDGK